MSPLRTLFRCFLAGVIAILPLAITVAVVVWVADFLAKLIGPKTAIGQLFAKLGIAVIATETGAYVIGWVLVLAVIFGLGVILELGARRIFQEKLDGMLGRVPLLGGIYGTVRQLTGMMQSGEQADLKGMSVVFCIFGNETGAAFLALLPTTELFRIGAIDYHAVLIPSAPVPVGGSLLFVPAASVKPAGISIDAFMSVYVSMGVTGPEFMKSMVSQPQAPPAGGVK